MLGYPCAPADMCVLLGCFFNAAVAGYMLASSAGGTGLAGRDGLTVPSTFPFILSMRGVVRFAPSSNTATARVWDSSWRKNNPA